jgi:hypothetical protein
MIPFSLMGMVRKWLMGLSAGASYRPHEHL